MKSAGKTMSEKNALLQLLRFYLYSQAERLFLFKNRLSLRELCGQIIETIYPLIPCSFGLSLIT